MVGIERDHGPWAPAFRVAFFQAGASLAVGSASAALRWSLARLELSPFAVALTDGLVARA